MQRRCRSCGPRRKDRSPSSSDGSRDPEIPPVSRLARCRGASVKVAKLCTRKTSEVYQRFILRTYKNNKQLLDDVGLGTLAVIVLWILYREFCLCFTGLLWNAMAKGIGIFGCTVLLIILISNRERPEDVQTSRVPDAADQGNEGTMGNRSRAESGNQESRSRAENRNEQDDSGAAARRDRRRRERRRRD
ncbi:uncharacterized protein LOC135163591 [Diachasmimorpha longicaudata]|uniref:uncharacterized protein LOC135163591 n=1 Tax=Diachasmimorpha longicaudata TaxID=58733 RepID=UPI0030B9181C